MIEAARKFICVKVNVSHDPDTAIALGVEAIPTVALLSPEGDLLEEPLVGATPAHELQLHLQQISGPPNDGA